MEGSEAVKTDNRQKVDHDEVLRLKREGTKPSEIAEKFGVAIGTVYKILREKGEGSGRTLNRQSKGFNVSADFDAMIERSQKAVDSLDENLTAAKERHAEELATITREAEKAKTILGQLTELRKGLDSAEGDGSENGSDAKAETPAKAGAKK